MVVRNITSTYVYFKCLDASHSHSLQATKRQGKRSPPSENLLCMTTNDELKLVFLLLEREITIIRYTENGYDVKCRIWE
jgi:hypothetical protein